MLDQIYNHLLTTWVDEFKWNAAKKAQTQVIAVKEIWTIKQSQIIFQIDLFQQSEDSVWW